MRVTRSPALSFLLAFAVVAAGVPIAAAASDDASGAAYTVTPARNTTSYLAVDGSAVVSDRYGSASLDVAGSVAADAESLHGEYEVLSLRASFFGTDDSARRIQLLRREAARIESRTAALQERQRLVLQRYNSGAITTNRLLRELARIDTASRELESQIRTIRRDVEPAGSFSLPNDMRTRYDNLQSGLVALQGPVRSRLANSLATGDSTQVYTLTTDDALVLATTTNNRYVREAYLASQRQPGAVDEFGQSDRPRISVAYQRAAELYPWAFENALAPPSATGFGNSSVYRISVDHSQGDLTTYLDGSTRSAFHEVQNKRLRSVPMTEVSNSTVPLTLKVNHSHGTGPMQVTLVRNADDEPINGTVRFDGEVVGHTGADGTLWTVTPYGHVRVNVTTPEGESVTVAFSPE